MYGRVGKYRFSLFIKLLIGLFLAVISLYFFGLFINIWAANDVRQMILDSTKQQVYNYLDSLEKEVERIIKVQTEYLDDSDILNLGRVAEVMYDYEKIERMLRVMSQLNMIKTVSSYIENINIHIPLIGRTISSKNEIRQLDTEELNALKSYTSLHGLPIIWWNERLYLNVPFPVPKLSYSQELIFDISVELSQSMIKKDLSNLIFYAGSGAVIINKQTGYIIGDGNNNILSDIKDYLSSDKVKEVKEGQETAKFDNEDFLIVYKYSEYLDLTLLAFIPQKQILGPLDNYKRLSLALSGLSVVIVIFFVIWTYKMVREPLECMVEAFGEVEKGNLNISINRKNNDEFGYLYEQFNKMVKNLESLFKETYEQKIRLKNAELKQLQYQINPHFLYNSIFLIYRMAKMEDYDGVIKLAEHLGYYYQFITRSDRDVIPLQEEIKHAKNYVEIQNVRFGDRIKVVWQQDERDYSRIMVPRLILQPLIENAYQHGLKNKLKDGEIRIKIATDDRRISISIEDNGVGIDNEALLKLQDKLSNMDEEIETTAIVNIHRRLRIKYGYPSGVTVSRSQIGGFKAAIEIFLEGDHDVSAIDCR